MWRALRPSKIADMPAIVNSFWMRKGYEGLTFFGTILTPTEDDAIRFNAGNSAMKNHEMIHLRQAQNCHDSWVCFYLLYIWYWFRALPMNWKIKNGAYLLNPFEMEAYGRMYEMDYLERCADGAREWRTYAKIPLKKRMELLKKIFPNSI